MGAVLPEHSHESVVGLQKGFSQVSGAEHRHQNHETNDSDGQPDVPGSVRSPSLTGIQNGSVQIIPAMYLQSALASGDP